MFARVSIPESWGWIWIFLIDLMNYKRILTVQDISCLGQCSLTVALPILSACGQETVILPSAVLSSHTGGFGKPNVRDLTGDFPGIMEHWKQVGVDFDTILTGYLGDIREIELVKEIFDSMTAPGGKRVVDPAMADHGKLYSGFNAAYAAAMKGLCDLADVVMPNITEAAMMAGLPYQEEYNDTYIEKLLAGQKAPCVVLTGVSYRPDETGVVVADHGTIRYHSHKKVPRSYHGTGDIFASAFVGAWSSGKDLFDAAVIASEFTRLCIEETYANPAHWYGVKFEPCLGKLIDMLK